MANIYGNYMDNLHLYMYIYIYVFLILILIVYWQYMDIMWTIYGVVIKGAYR
jgi:hypothetical protein